MIQSRVACEPWSAAGDAHAHVEIDSAAPIAALLLAALTTKSVAEPPRGKALAPAAAAPLPAPAPTTRMLAPPALQTATPAQTAPAQTATPTLTLVPAPLQTATAVLPPARTPLHGWVDMHTHPMVNLGFGGKLVHGAPDIGSLITVDKNLPEGPHDEHRSGALQRQRHPWRLGRLRQPVR